MLNLVGKFFGFALIFFAVYFALMFLKENPLKKQSKKSSLLVTFEQQQFFGGGTEFAQKLKESLSSQPEIMNFMPSIHSVVLKSQIQNAKINAQITAELQRAIAQKPDGLYSIEVEAFDDLMPERRKSRKATKESNPETLHFQLSFFDIKSNNKIGEAGLSIQTDLLSETEKD
jgi:hypothetical protein